MSYPSWSDDVPFDMEVRRVLEVASWIGHLQREQRGSDFRAPPVHWREVAAALLIAEDRTSRWMQAAAEASLLLRAPLLPDPPLAWQARRSAAAVLAPPGGDGHFTTSVGDGLLSEAPGRRVNGNALIEMVHLLAAMLFASGPAHEKELYELAPPDGEALRRLAAIWLVEFQDRLNAVVCLPFWVAPTSQGAS